MSADRTARHDTRNTAPPEGPSTRGASRSGWSRWPVLRRLLWTSTVASACTTTRLQTAPVQEPLPTGPGGEIRLTRRSGGVVSLYNARFVQDSIVGQDRPGAVPDARRIAVANADIESLAIVKKQVSIGKTILAVIGGVLATFSFLLLLACASLSAS